MPQDTLANQNTAATFVAALGVNTKAGYYIDGYTNASLIINSLDYLGISTVRDSYSQYGQSNTVLDALAAADIKFDFRVSYTLPASGEAGIESYIAAIKAFVAEHPGSVIAIEGINEANIGVFSYNGDSSLAGAAAFQKDLYTAIKADPELSSVVVYNLSLSHGNAADYAALGDLGAYSDAANAHPYPVTGNPVDGQIESVFVLAGQNSSGDPLVVTETGYTTLASTDGIGVSESAQAKLILQNLLAAYEDGSTATYLYELFDEPSIATTRGNKEASFGLFNADGTPKQAAVTIHNLTTILNFGNDGTASTASATDFTLSGAPTNTHSMVLTKSGDVYDIVLWENTTVWNDVTDTDIVNPTTTVTVNLGEVASTVRIYDPLLGLDPIATYTNVSSFTVPLSDHPLIIEVGATQAVQEQTTTSAADLSMTSAEFVAQMDALAKADGIETVTLTDDHVLAVASVETMQYMIANYGTLLSKISGQYSFSVTYGQDTWTKQQLYDANGNLTTRIEIGLANGDVTSKAVYNVDGTSEYTNYKIVGQTYTIQHQAFNAAGVAVLTERFHADGTRDYVQTIGADGTKDTVIYNSAGQKISDVTVGTDGSTTTLTYDSVSGNLVTSISRDASFVVTTKNYTNGILMRTVVQNTDGTSDYYHYNITGQTYTSQHQILNAAGVAVLIERFHADGTRDYVQTIAADGTKDTILYNSAGQKLSDVSVGANGTTTLTYDPATGNLTQSVEQTSSGTTTKTYTAGVLTRTAVVNADGTSEYYNYGITGQSYTSQHQIYNAAGTSVLLERFHADGTKDYVQTIAADGTKNTVLYNSAGQKLSDATVGNDGITTTLTYDPATGNLTQSVEQNSSGTTTKTYTAGVLTRTAVVNADGTSEYYNYGITGQSYTSQHQIYNAAGTSVLLERFHADGTKDYVQTIAADGTKNTVLYNSAGQKLSDATVSSDGITTTLTYDPGTGNLTQSTVQNSSGTTTNTYAGGVLTRVVSLNADGTSDYYSYGITGQTYTTQHQTFNAAGTSVLLERFHADGTRDYVQTIAADGTKDTILYNSAGQKLSDVSVGTNGTTTTLTFDPTTGNLTQSVEQNSSGTTTKTYTAGVLTRTAVVNADGTSDYYNYGITGQTYTSQHQAFNAAGTSVLLERFHADGTRDYVQTIAADGTKNTILYNSAGQKLSDATVGANGTTTTLTYDPATGSLTQSVEQ
ncbi:beta strand repeat-containing protein, partial [Xanthobacter autotrophicus]|uniref:beta strand repeat-containing protein n=1 Tax=Xanthobacter autotrophicus TaxID=280 RepID=UPI0037284C9B